MPSDMFFWIVKSFIEWFSYKIQPALIPFKTTNIKCLLFNKMNPTPSCFLHANFRFDAEKLAECVSHFFIRSIVFYTLFHSGWIVHFVPTCSLTFLFLSLFNQLIPSFKKKDTKHNGKTFCYIVKTTTACQCYQINKLTIRHNTIYFRCTKVSI